MYNTTAGEADRLSITQTTGKNDQQTMIKRLTRPSIENQARHNTNLHHTQSAVVMPRLSDGMAHSVS